MDTDSFIVYINRITFKRKTGRHLELLTPETIKLLGRIKVR